MAITCLNGFLILSLFSVAYEMTIYVVRHSSDPPIVDAEEKVEPQIGSSLSIRDSSLRPQKTIGEASICGVINMLSNIFAFLVVLGLTPILNGGNVFDVLIADLIFAVVISMAMGLMLIYKA
jgi:hypothetical protein